MNKEARYWILSCLSEASGKEGIEVTKLFEQRPDSIPDDLAKFFKFLLDLEHEGFVEFNKEMSSPYYRITDKGRKSLQEYLKTANIKDVFRFTSNAK